MDSDGLNDTSPVGDPTAVGTSSWLTCAAPSVIGSWLGARAIVGLAFAVAHALAPHVSLPVGRLHLNERLLYWDGAYYRTIAAFGYGGTTPDSVRFFPLYPLLGRWLAPVFAGRIDVALVVISNVCAIAAMFVLWKLITELGYSPKLATRSAMFLTLFPASGVLAFAYAESLFLLCLLVAALMITRHRPLSAAVPLLAIGIIRPTGVLVGVAVLVAAILAFRERPDRRTWAHALSWLAALAAPFVSFAGYLFWLSATGRSWTGPLDYQREFRAGFREPITRIVSAAVNVFSGDFADVYNLAFAVVLIAAIVIAILRRVSMPWTAYLIAGMLVASSANNINSLGRYGLMLAPAWPLAMAMFSTPDHASHGDNERHARSLLPLVYPVAIVASSVGLLWYTTVTLLGLVIP